MGSELPAILTHDDHARGCQGREYACTCGYDDRVATTLSAQEEQIERLREALDQLLDDMGETGLSVCQAAKEMAIAALEGSKRDGD